MWRMQVFLVLFCRFSVGLKFFKIKVAGKLKNTKARMVIWTVLLHGLCFHLVPRCIYFSFSLCFYPNIFFLAVNIMKKITDLIIKRLYSHLLFFFLFLTFYLSSESIYRRGARRWRKLYCANGHTFQAKRFNRVNHSFLNVW